MACCRSPLWPLLGLLGLGAAAGGRIVSFADLHGDFDHTIAMLRAAGLAEEADSGVTAAAGEPPFSRYRGVRWIGGDATLVQTGDMVDRGDYGRDLYALFADLRAQAPEAGGRVVNLVGNHDLLNLMEDLRYVSPGDYREFGGKAQRRKAFSLNGWLGRQIAEEFQGAAVIGDTVFVHAGVHPDFAKGGIDQLNEDVRHALTAVLRGGSPNSHGVQLVGSGGIFWMRKFTTGSEASACPLVKKTLQLLGARRMVVGHTQVDDGKVNPRCQGLLLMADTIISRAYGHCWDPGTQAAAGCVGTMTFLEFRGSEADAVRVDEETGELLRVPLPKHVEPAEL